MFHATVCTANAAETMAMLYRVSQVARDQAVLAPEPEVTRRSTVAAVDIALDAARDTRAGVPD